MSEKRKIKKYPFGAITITSESKRIIREILKTKRLSGGKFVREFEARFARLTQTKEAVAVSSGTDADALALAVLYDFGAKRGDEVIIPALSFSSTGSAVLQAGFRPVFVDIERETLNIDVSGIERAITRKTRAIMPVHLMGKPADMTGIKRIAGSYKLFVIEDAAEAQGARYRGKNVGQLGDMAAFSLYLAHIISTVEGGIVTTDREDFAEVLRSLRAHGRACKCRTCVVNLSSAYCPRRFQYGEDVRFVFERIGFSAKMNELEAAIGLGYLDNYHKFFKIRLQNYRYLKNQFKKFKNYFITIESSPDEKIAPYAFPIILKADAQFTRDAYILFLEKNGIEARTLFSSMPTQCAGFRFLGYKKGDFPEAEYVGKMGLHIGVHHEIKKEQIDYFIDATELFLQENL